MADPKIRVALIGCGAISRLYHAPVLAGHPSIELRAMVDTNPVVAQHLAHLYGVTTVLANARDLSRDHVDAAVVAVPSALHAEVTQPLLEAGLHVLVEKPIASTRQGAANMVQAAERHGVVLAVGHFRRMFPATRLMAALLRTRAYGRVLSFTAEEGHLFDWPSATLALMRRDLAGGGVLMDMGCHVLDQLMLMMPGTVSVTHYADNQFGGIESDAILRLQVLHEGRSIPGSIELSRTRRLENKIHFACEMAKVSVGVGERTTVEIAHLPAATDPRDDRARSVALRAEWTDSEPTDPYAPFRAQVDDWVEAITRGRRPFLSATSAAAVIDVIEAAYDSRSPLEESWVSQGIQERTPAPSIIGRAKPRVLVTGAAGFIGTRTCELLALREGFDVRALVHNPANASRVARLPIELVAGDIRREADVQRAVQGCQAVVHAAYGTAWGDRRAIVDTTVGGTRRLVEAAAAEGISSFVHLSTTAVHGTRVSGTINPRTPIAPDRDLYPETKAAAEAYLRSQTRLSAGVTLLRLPNVYGPYSGPFTVRIVDHLKRGIPTLVDEGDQPSNSIYVDNVVAAIICALKEPNAARGLRTYVVADEEPMSWRDYVAFHARLAGVDPVRITSDEISRLRTQAAPPRWWDARRYVRAGKELILSDETMALAKRFLVTDPLGTIPRALLSHPRVKPRLKAILGSEAPAVYTGEAIQEPAELPFGLFDLYGIRAPVDFSEAQRDLRYVALVRRDHAMKLTASWLKFSRLA